jgi:hypothetical protein
MKAYPRVVPGKLMDVRRGLWAVFALRWYAACVGNEPPSTWPELWGEYFWSPSNCAVSRAGAPLDAVKCYVKKQRGGACFPALKGSASALGAIG